MSKDETIKQEAKPEPAPPQPEPATRPRTHGEAAEELLRRHEPGTPHPDPWAKP